MIKNKKGTEYVSLHVEEKKFELIKVKKKLQKGFF